MNKSLPHQAINPPVRRVTAGTDCFGEERSLGISTIDFKVTPQDSRDLLIIENTFHTKYVLEGQFIVEVGAERFRLDGGDALLAPRQVSHVWAYVGYASGRILITFMPAGKMEAFFREVTKANAMPSQDPELWRAHGMELLGPPLAVT
jgi:hypothetical protein